MTDHNARWRELSARVREAWGAQAQWELETVTAIAGEILDRSKEAEDHVWVAALDEILTGPQPRVRSLPRLLAAALRRHVGAARQLRPTLDTGGEDTAYSRALAALLGPGPCPPPGS